MPRESNLWKNLKSAERGLRAMGHKCDLQRIENAAGVGHPDVEGCVWARGNPAQQVWLELKCADRPKKESTPIRFKTRPAQAIWHRERAEAGFMRHWVLLQIGDGIKRGIYLIPGSYYTALSNMGFPEDKLAAISCCLATDDLCTVLLRAAQGW